MPSKALAKGDNPLPMETLRVLSREYRQVLVDDRQLRKIEFHNPAAADPDLHVRALVRRADGSWTSENWDGKTTVEFCRDDPDEDVREVILAYSNSSIDRKLAPATRFQAEESCSLRFRVLAANVQYQTNASADHILCGRQSGRNSFSGSGNAPYEYVTNAIETRHGRVEGSIGAKAVAGWSGHHLEGCKIGADGLEPCSVDMPPVSPRPDGMWGVSFSVTRRRERRRLDAELGLRRPRGRLLQRDLHRVLRAHLGPLGPGGVEAPDRARDLPADHPVHAHLRGQRQRDRTR